MRLQDIGLVGCQGEHVAEHGLAHGHAAAVLPEEPAGERLVEEFGLVRDDVVENRDGRDSFPAKPTGYGAERRGQVAHPVFHDDEIWLPGGDFAGGTAPGERVDSVEDGLAVHFFRLVLRGYILRLSREKEGRILAGEGKGFDFVLLSEGFEQVGVELGDAAPEWVKSGKICDSHQAAEGVNCRARDNKLSLSVMR